MIRVAVEVVEVSLSGLATSHDQIDLGECYKVKPNACKISG